MKSIFQEASSLGDAIEKAWEAVGSPEEFEVKVLKHGENKFFGLFCKTPFAVCITASSDQNNNKNSSLKKQDDDNCSTLNTCFNEKPSRYQPAAKSQPKPFSGRKPTRQSSVSSQPLPNSTFTESIKNDEYSPVLEVEADNWILSDALLAEDFLKEILEIIGLKNFVLRSNTEKNFLNLAIVCLEGKEFLEKSFFICIAPLIVQMVKKSSGKTPKGLRIVISHIEE